MNFKIIRYWLAGTLSSGCLFGQVASVPPPIITPNGGNYKGSVQYSIYSQTPNSTIHYTSDGAVPLANSPIFVSGSVMTLSGTGTKTIQAVVIDSNNNNSPVAIASFKVAAPASAALPEISPNGGNGTNAIKVTLSSATKGAVLYYTTDGSAPTTGSNRYVNPIILTSKGSQTVTIVNVISTAPGLVQSGVVSRSFTVGYSSTAAVPSLSPPDSSFTGWTWVTATTTEPNAIIRYTLDGTTPDPTSTQYVGPVYISNTTTLKARTFVSGEADSTVTVAIYTAKDADRVANENVAAYGVLPTNTGAENTRAIQSINIHNALRTSLPERIRLYFPTGKYQFAGTITIAGANNLVLDGQGSTLVFSSSGAYTPFYLAATQDLASPNNITLENMTIQMTNPPFASGYVTNATPNYFDVMLDHGQAAASIPVGMAKNLGYLQYDPTDLSPSRGGQDRYVHWTSTALGPNKIRINDAHNKVHPGDYFAIRESPGESTIYAQGCNELTLQNVQLNDSPDMGLIAADTTDITVRHCSIIRAQDSNHPTTLAADGLHLTSCRGLISIQDLTVQNQGDDGINVCGTYFPIKSVDGNRVAVGASNGPPKIAKGELLQFSDQSTMLPLGSAVVTAVDSGLKTETLTLDRTVSTITPGDMVNSLTWVPHLAITRSTFSGNRGRGVLVQTSEATVQNCRFYDITSSAVDISADFAGTFEATAPNNVSVFNNSIEDCNRGCSWILGSGAIATAMYYQRGNTVVHGSAGSFSNLVIADNTLLNIDNGGIAVKSVDQADISNNTLENCAQKPVGKIPCTDDAIAVQNAKNVRLRDNTQVLSTYLRFTYDQTTPAAPAGGYNVQPFLIGFSITGPHKIRFSYAWDVQDNLPTTLTPFVSLYNAPGTFVATFPNGDLPDSATWPNGNRTISAPVTVDLSSVIPGGIPDGTYTIRMGLSDNSTLLGLVGEDDGKRAIIVGTLIVSESGSRIVFETRQYDVRPFVNRFIPLDSRTFSLSETWEVNDTIPPGTTIKMCLYDSGGNSVARINPGNTPDTGTWIPGTNILSTLATNSLPEIADRQYSLRVMLYNPAVSASNLPLSGNRDSEYRVIVGTLNSFMGKPSPIWIDPETTSNISVNDNTGF